MFLTLLVAKKAVKDHLMPLSVSVAQARYILTKVTTFQNIGKDNKK